MYEKIRKQPGRRAQHSLRQPTTLTKITQQKRRRSSFSWVTVFVWLPWLALGCAGIGIVAILRFPHESLSVPTKSTGKIPVRNAPNLVFDLVSSGSVLRPRYQEIQKEAFTKYPMVRHFYPLTEKNDTEITCHTDLIWNRVKDTLAFCRRRPTNNTYLDSIRKYFGITGNGNLIHLSVEYARGWICAQKRPMAGFVKLLQSYRSGVIALPDYLIFMDDDTYMNMNNVEEYLRKNRPSSQPFVITGCLIWMDVEGRAWSWTWGGYGAFLSKASLERLLRPIDCKDDENDDFVANACHRLQENLIGEQSAFVPGMSLADLMERYTFRHAYLDVKTWSDVGFCLHSDHIWTFFANYYLLSSTNPHVTYAHAQEDRIYPYNESRVYPMMRPKNPDREWGQCLNRDEDSVCTADSHICHRISEQRMAELWQIPLPHR